MSYSGGGRGSRGGGGGRGFGGYGGDGSSGAGRGPYGSGSGGGGRGPYRSGSGGGGRGPYVQGYSAGGGRGAYGQDSGGGGGRGAYGQDSRGGGGRGQYGGGRGSYGQGTPAAEYSTPETWKQAGSGAGDAAALSKQVEQRLKLAPSSSKAIEPPLRPCYGKIGRPCAVRANHFLVQLSYKDNDLYHYDVSIASENESKEAASKEITSKKLCKKVMDALVREYRESFLGNLIPAFDGKKSLYTAGPFPFKSKQFVVPLLEDVTDAQSKEKKFKVTIKEAARIDSHQLVEFLSSRVTDNPQDAIQALDVVMRAAAPLNYVAIGRSFFSTSLGRDELGEGLEYCRGYYQSVRPVRMGLSLNVDASARPFYKAVFLHVFVADFLKRRGLSKPLTDQERLKVKRVLRGVLVETYYMTYTKCYKINSLSSERADHLIYANLWKLKDT